MIHRMHRSVAASLACALLCAAGCVSAPAPTDDHDDLRNRVVLSRQLLDIADHVASVTSDSVSLATLNGSDATRIAVLCRIRDSVSEVVRALALSPDPREGLIRMYVWVHLGERACANRVRLNPQMVPDNCEEVYGSTRAKVDALAARAIDPAVRQHLDGIVSRYLDSHPELLTVGLRRIDDVVSADARTEEVLDRADDSMFRPVTDAARQLEETRLLGDRLVWLLSRLPGAAGNEAETAGRIILENDRVKQAVERLEKATAVLDDSARSIHDVADAHRELSGRIGELAVQIETVGEEARSVRFQAVAVAIGYAASMIVTVSIASFAVVRAIRGRPAPQGRG